MGKKVIENSGSERIINNQGHCNTLQARYFFNTTLKVPNVPKCPLYKNTILGGTYYV